MSKGELAESLYHGEEGYNCAQAIFKAFQEELKVSEQVILDAAQQGRGKAPNGTCGALFAALELSTSDNAKNSLQLTFTDKAGSTHCKTIRTNRKLSCKACVKLAADSMVNNQ